VKLLFFDDFRLGILKGETVIDVSDAVKGIPHIGPHDLINGLIERFDEYRSALQQASDRGKGIPVSGVRLRPPLPRPVNIDCMAVNFEDGTRDVLPPINAFLKTPNSIIGDGDTMVLPDVPATIFEGRRSSRWLSASG
jgi:2-keto-4-pentenoate hydratase/2-oxohepta-3-ene-1,7-dioic acid hydratase in catechol pathway